MTQILFLISMFILSIIIIPIGIILSVIIAPSKFLNHVKRIGLSLDQFANVMGKYLFDLILITGESSSKFGAVDETISSVIGKNHQTDTLTLLGKFIYNILDRLDKNHSIDAIEDDEGMK